MSKSRIGRGGIEELIDINKVDRLGLAVIEKGKGRDKENYIISVDGLKDKIVLSPNASKNIRWLPKLSIGLSREGYYLARAHMEFVSLSEGRERKVKIYLQGELYRER